MGNAMSSDAAAASSVSRMSLEVFQHAVYTEF
jgi:hypothetical protein